MKIWPPTVDAPHCKVWISIAKMSMPAKKKKRYYFTVWLKPSKSETFNCFTLKKAMRTKMKKSATIRLCARLCDLRIYRNCFWLSLIIRTGLNSICETSTQKKHFWKLETKSIRAKWRKTWAQFLQTKCLNLCSAARLPKQHCSGNGTNFKHHRWHLFT